ncbi:hypothetical protein FOA52_011486 [Chlamydomonas sp. UWO 241]|nr:hypothetical protein FOA52_011486 [Chlamydomonas sp. UWO 241]
MGSAQPEFDPARVYMTVDEKDAPSAMNLQFESSKEAKPAAAHGAGGLARAPLSGGVRTATARYALPSPTVAVRNLVEIARFGHLCTTMSGMHHRRAGYPFGTLIDFAVDGAGHPIFCLSTLAIHSRNLLEDPRCSLVVQMPGWTGLANARVTIFGDAHALPSELQDEAKMVFAQKEGDPNSFRSSNFVFFRMDRITDIYFVGGFGTVQWITPAEYLSCAPDAIVITGNPTKTLQALTEAFQADLTTLMTAAVGRTVTEVMFISIDANGADLRLRCAQEFNVERLAFGHKVTTLDEAMVGVKSAVAVMKATLMKEASVAAKPKAAK